MILKSLFLILVIFGFGARPAAAQIPPEDSHFINPQYSNSTSKKISLDFKNAALSDVLKVFSKQSGMNFIAAEDVSKKKVTLFLEDIAVEEALEKILDANNLEYEIKPGSNIFTVHGRRAETERVTRVYALKHASVSATRVRGWALPSDGDKESDASSSSTGGGGSSAGSSAAFSTGSDVSMAPTNKGISDVLKSLMSPTGVLVEDARTNSLIITDLIGRFPDIEATIAKLDVSIPEILIEVEMLDISKSTSDLVGVKFGSTLFKLTGAAKNTVFPFNQSAALEGGKVFLTPETSTTGTKNSKGYQLGTLSFADMTAVVNFLKTRSDTRHLARPRIMTLNNETAQIRVATNEAIGVLTTTFSASSAVSSAVQAERVQTGVFLTVTPQADLDTRQIIMSVWPKVVQARRGGTFEGHTFNDAEERGTQSLLKVRDGETIIIGGLLRSDDGRTLTKVPILSSIPFFGAAFRHRDVTSGKRELVIFLTPHILDDNNKNEWNLPVVDDAFRGDEVEKALSDVEGKRF